MAGGRLLIVDTLRGVGAVSVMYWHLTNSALFSGRRNQPYQLSVGYMGVQLFFVISGFVIFITLNRCKTIVDYIFSRTVRLVPTLYVCLLLIFCCSHIMVAIQPALKHRNAGSYNLPDAVDFFLGLTMMDNYYEVELDWYNPVISPAWTLSIEITFYVFMGILFAANLLRYVQWFLLAWMIVEVTINHTYRDQLDPLLYQFLILEHAHFFCTGVCFSLLYERYGAGSERQKLPTEHSPLLLTDAIVSADPVDGRSEVTVVEFAGYRLRIVPPYYSILAFLWQSWPELCLLGFSFYLTAFDHESGHPWGAVKRQYPNTYHWVYKSFFILVSSAFTFIIAAARWRNQFKALDRIAAVFENPLFVYFGSISYALYLIHEEFSNWVIIPGFCGVSSVGERALKPAFGIGRKNTVSPDGCVVIASFVSILLATAVTFLFEKPLMGRLHKWYKSRGKH